MRLLLRRAKILRKAVSALPPKQGMAKLACKTGGRREDKRGSFARNVENCFLLVPISY